MVNVWIHKPGDETPFLAAEVSVADAMRDFDLDQASFIAPLGDRPISPEAPGPLADRPDPEIVLFEVLASERNGAKRPGYYVSDMTAYTVQELLTEEWAVGTGQSDR